MDTDLLHAYVVEDNPSLCETLVGTLEELTCVRVAATGSTQSQATEWLADRAHEWDLLIVDLFLKGGSGMHLLEQLGARESWQKVIVFSNYVNADVRKHCARLGVDAVFDKSTQIDALVDYCARQCYLRGQARGRTAGEGRSPGPLPPSA